MLRRQSDLLLGIVLTLILLVLGFFGLRPPIFQAILVLPLILFVPGNALSWAILPGPELQRLERFLFAIGLSLGVTMLSGLVLNLTPWGLQAGSWVLILSGITLAASLIAIIRRGRIPAQAAQTVRFYIPLRQVGLLGLAIMVLGFSLKLTLTPRPASNLQGYTSLWVSPIGETQPGTLLIGIESQEVDTVFYHLQVTYNGQLRQEWSDISLAPGGKSQKLLTMPAGPGFAEASLYRADSPAVVYRRVSITLNP